MPTKWTEENKKALLNLMQSDTPLAKARKAFSGSMVRIAQCGEQGEDIFTIREMEFFAVMEIAKVLGIEFNPGGTIKEVTND
jgi:hypothetical protein